MKSLVRLDPFRMMRTWDPFDELRSMQREMERVFDRFLGTDRRGEIEHVGLWMPSIESYTKDGILHIKADLPGIDPKDLDVSITERELVIKGERKGERDEKEKDYSYREISYGSFERHFMLPEGVKSEDLKASFTKGVLEVTVPVPFVAAPKARKVEIATEEKKRLEAGGKKAA